MYILRDDVSSICFLSARQRDTFPIVTSCNALLPSKKQGGINPFYSAVSLNSIVAVEFNFVVQRFSLVMKTDNWSADRYAVAPKRYRSQASCPALSIRSYLRSHNIKAKYGSPYAIGECTCTVLDHPPSLWTVYIDLNSSHSQWTEWRSVKRFRRQRLRSARCELH